MSALIDDLDIMDKLADISRIFIYYTDKRLRCIQLRTGQAAILSIVGRHGKLSQKEISMMRNMSPATISVLLGRMEREGLIIKEDPLDGGRASDISLSPKGVEKYEYLREFMEGEANTILRGFSEQDKIKLIEVYEKLMDNVSGEL